MIPRLYLDNELEESLRIPLSSDQSHYLRNVLRRKEGDNIVIFNGRQGEYHATLERLSKKDLGLRVGLCKRPQYQEGDIWLCHAPLQRNAQEYLIEKATELGVSRFLPVTTQYSGPHRLNLTRFKAIAKEAAEQTERLTLPAFDEPTSLSEILRNWPEKRQLIICAEAGETIPLARFLQSTSYNLFALMTGPEGGYAETELDLFKKFPFVTCVGLGPRILRAETASLAALAIFQAVKGDGDERAPRPMRDL